MKDSKRITVAFTDCELVFVDELKNKFRDRMEWKITRHALLKMALLRGLKDIQNSYIGLEESMA